MAKSADPEHLTVTEDRCIAEFMGNGGNQTAAFRSAFPSSKNWKPETVWKRASEFFAQPKVKARVAELRELTAKEAVIRDVQLLRETANIAMSDIRRLHDHEGNLLPMSEWPADAAAAVASIQYEEVHVPASRGKKAHTRLRPTRITLWNKLQAQEKLYKHMGLYAIDNAQKASFQETGFEALPIEVRRLIAQELRRIVDQAGAIPGEARSVVDPESHAIPGESAPKRH